jgi:3-methylcrotonyl-CoA carboxylase beta subunit
VTSEVKPLRPAEELYDIIPEDHKQPYNARSCWSVCLDDGHLDEFQADYAKEMITGTRAFVAFRSA